MIWSFRLNALARRQLRSLPENIQREVGIELKEMEHNGPPDEISGDDKGPVRLRGTRNDWRIKFYGYRMLYRVHQERRTIRVLRIELRSETTYRGYNPED